MADASLVQKGVPSLILQDDLTRQLRSMAADAAQAPCQAVFDLNEFNELTSLEASFWLFDCLIWPNLIFWSCDHSPWLFYHSCLRCENHWTLRKTVGQPKAWGEFVSAGGFHNDTGPVNMAVALTLISVISSLTILDHLLIKLEVNCGLPTSPMWSWKSMLHAKNMWSTL